MLRIIHLTALAVLLVGCSEKMPLDAKRVAAIEHACIISRFDVPTKCGCVAEAVAAQPDRKIDRMVIARMKNDERALKREVANLSDIETGHLMMRYENVGKAAFMHCGRARSG